MDIIWVIDSSPSMGDEQISLKDNFSSFINSFLEANKDEAHFSNFEYRMAVADTGPRYLRHNNKRYYKLELGSLYNMGLVNINSDSPVFDPLRLDKSTPLDQLTDHFIKDILLGIKGSGKESGGAAAMASMLRGLTADQLKGLNLTPHAKEVLSPNNKDFFRKDTELHFIMVSDEEDCLAKTNRRGGCHDINYYSRSIQYLLIENLIKARKETSEDYAKRFLTELRKVAKILKPEIYADILDEDSKRDIVIHTITRQKDGAHNLGVFYKTLSEQTEGSVTDIGDEFSNILQSIGEKIVTKLERNFTLDFTPVIDTDRPLSISYSIPEDNTDNLEGQEEKSFSNNETLVNPDTYTINGNTIIFKEGVNPPPANSILKVIYHGDVTNRE